jgi:hypothetical protein
MLDDDLLDPLGDVAHFDHVLDYVLLIGTCG